VLTGLVLGGAALVAIPSVRRAARPALRGLLKQYLLASKELDRLRSDLREDLEDLVAEAEAEVASSAAEAATL
jgi:hypothetical protein